VQELERWKKDVEHRLIERDEHLFEYGKNYVREFVSRSLRGWGDTLVLVGVSEAGICILAKFIYYRSISIFADQGRGNRL
jgi:hypothetical protein